MKSRIKEIQPNIDCAESEETEGGKRKKTERGGKKGRQREKDETNTSNTETTSSPCGLNNTDAVVLFDTCYSPSSEHMSVCFSDHENTLPQIGFNSRVVTT